MSTFQSVDTYTKMNKIVAIEAQGEHLEFFSLIIHNWKTMARRMYIYVHTTFFYFLLVRSLPVCGFDFLEYGDAFVTHSVIMIDAVC